MEPEFEWDPDKGEENAKKHGVSFDEAKTVLFDPLRSMVADVEHSNSEARWVTVGQSSASRLLRVVYADRIVAGRLRVRIISARGLARRERDAYEDS